MCILLLLLLLLYVLCVSYDIEYRNPYIHTNNIAIQQRRKQSLKRGITKITTTIKHIQFKNEKKLMHRTTFCLMSGSFCFRCLITNNVRPLSIELILNYVTTYNTIFIIYFLYIVRGHNKI